MNDINPAALVIFLKEFHPEILTEFETRYIGYFRELPKGKNTIKRAEIFQGVTIGYHAFKR